MLDKPVKRRLVINLCLVIAVAVLLLSIWLGNTDTNQPQPADHINATSIDTIHIQLRKNPEILISKIDERWEIVEPVATAASPFRVNSLLNVTSATSYASFPVANIDLTELGLTNPLAIMTLNRHVIKFGDQDPINGYRYTQIDNQIYLLDDRYLPLLKLPITSLVDTQLLPDHLWITEFQLPGFRIISTETGGWRIEPEGPDLGSDILQEWVDRWRRLRASNIEYHPQVTTADKPTVVIKLKDDKDIALVVVQTEDWSGLYWLEKSIGYAISEENLKKILSRPDANSNQQ